MIRMIGWAISVAGLLAGSGPLRAADSKWMVSTRGLTSNACAADLDAPAFQVSQLDRRGGADASSLDALLEHCSPQRPVVLHVHGNRMSYCDALHRGLFIQRRLRHQAPQVDFDFVIFTWPSQRSGSLIQDGRAKARMTEAEGLYLGWLLRELARREIPVAVVAYSFGCRVVTGALHSMAGGRLSGRRLHGEPIQGAGVAVGLVAPAMPAHWLQRGQYHGLASRNVSRMTVLYNSRDAVLKRFWLLDFASRDALGYTGPRGIAPGASGDPVPLSSRDCARFLGLRHSEVEYYTGGCSAGRTMAGLIRSLDNLPTSTASSAATLVNETAQ